MMFSVGNVILRILFLWISFSFSNVYSLTPQAVGDDCVNENNTSNPDGICTLVIHCEDAMRLLANTKRHNFFRCGFDGFTEIVCCPVKTDTKFDHTTESTNRKNNKRRADQECDKLPVTDPIETHIVNGETALLGEFPHMVAIGYKIDGIYEFRCGGSLISKTFVLTAAHCSKTRDADPEVIRGGVLDIGGNKWNDETDYLVEEIILYPNYTSSQSYNDIALLRLREEVAFTEFINAACLYTNANDPKTAVTVTGWGVTNVSTNAKSRLLQKVDLPIVNPEICRVTNKGNRKLPNGVINSQLCVGDLSGERDSCYGDSGGPLQIWANDRKYHVVGITSFGIVCATKDKPAIYTKVSSYLDWIESVVWPN